MQVHDFAHEPVMARQVVELLLPVAAGLIVDCTIGGAGHATRILEARSDVMLLGIDRDASAVAAASTRLAPFGARARVVRGGFDEIGDIVAGHQAEHGEGAVMGILFDLGVSSHQLDRAERGFSFRFDGPLDMRMDTRQALTAETVVNTYEEAELARIIRELGEERFAGRIARSICQARPLRGTHDLVDAIKRAIPAPARRRGGHPAKRTFQAIRMEVNRELESLADGLDESVHLVGPGGRILVLAYHSLEDRLVKERFATWAGERTDTPARLPVTTAATRPLVKVLTRKALRPGDDELAANPRAASVRLRAAERVEVAP